VAWWTILILNHDAPSAQLFSQRRSQRFSQTRERLFSQRGPTLLVFIAHATYIIIVGKNLFSCQACAGGMRASREPALPGRTFTFCKTLTNASCPRHSFLKTARSNRAYSLGMLNSVTADAAQNTFEYKSSCRSPSAPVEAIVRSQSPDLLGRNVFETWCCGPSSSRACDLPAIRARLGP
jgi:hypothetical protein